MAAPSTQELGELTVFRWLTGGLPAVDELGVSGRDVPFDETGAALNRSLPQAGAGLMPEAAAKAAPAALKAAGDDPRHRITTRSILASAWESLHADSSVDEAKKLAKSHGLGRL